MLVPLSNEPRDYAWGSHDPHRRADRAERRRAARGGGLVRRSPGRPAPRRPTGARSTRGSRPRAPPPACPAHLPYLLKLLAAASPLSIQAHPSKAQAEAGFAREEAAGIPRDAAERTYRDDEPQARAHRRGERHVPRARRAPRPRRDPPARRGARARRARRSPTRLDGPDAALGDVDRVAALRRRARAGAGDHRRRARAPRPERVRGASSTLVAELDAAYPGDPGIVVALLMNLVTLRRGEGLFVPAGVLHAYLEGLGVELMAASDNVLRGGLTPKHIDVAELLSVLDPTPGPAPLVRARAGRRGARAIRRPGCRLRPATSRVRRRPRRSRCRSTASRSRSRRRAR